MLTFVDPYSQHLSDAGCSDVRQASAPFHEKLEPPPQISSILFRGISSASSIRSQSFIRKSLPYSKLGFRKAFLFPTTGLSLRYEFILR